MSIGALGRDEVIRKSSCKQVASRSNSKRNIVCQSPIVSIKSTLFNPDAFRGLYEIQRQLTEKLPSCQFEKQTGIDLRNQTKNYLLS